VGRVWELRPYERSRCAEHGRVVAVLSEVCPPHRGWSWSHHPRFRATLQGSKANGRTGEDRQGREQRGHIGRLERGYGGESRPPTIRKLAEALTVDPRELPRRRDLNQPFKASVLKEA
jgi:hypothetical protein